MSPNPKDPSSTQDASTSSAGKVVLSVIRRVADTLKSVSKETIYEGNRQKRLLQTRSILKKLRTELTHRIPRDIGALAIQSEVKLASEAETINELLQRQKAFELANQAGIAGDKEKVKEAKELAKGISKLQVKLGRAVFEQRPSVDGLEPLIEKWDMVARQITEAEQAERSLIEAGQQRSSKSKSHAIAGFCVLGCVALLTGYFLFTSMFGTPSYITSSTNTEVSGKQQPANTAAEMQNEDAIESTSQETSNTANPKTVVERVDIAIALLQAERHAEFLETFLVPEKLKELKDSGQYDDIIARFPLSHAPELLSMLKSIQGTEPTMSEDGKTAWFESEKRFASRNTLAFMKVDGVWYIPNAPADSSPAPADSSPASADSSPALVGTGIKEKILISVMNGNGNLETKYHHEFQLESTNEDEVRFTVYRDKNSGLILVATGPPNDLTRIELGMPFDEFVGEKNGQLTGDGAAAFGRCVQRLGLAADPSWSEDLYNWMNKRMARVLLTPDDLYTKRKELVAKFGTLELDGDNKMVTMTIGRTMNSSE